MRPRRILSKSVPQPTDEIREAAAETAFLTNSQLPGDRTAVLREASGEDADRDVDKGHAAVREFVLVAVHGDHVTYDVETASGGLIHALRLPAVSAEPAIRLPEVPRSSRRRRDVIQRVPGNGDHRRRVLRPAEQRRRESRSVSVFRSHFCVLPSETHGAGILRIECQ